MSYQVIARKWRPQTFEEVTGQEPITLTLRNAVEHERLHHAYLFSGARGVGKTTTARLLAKALNCHKSERPTPTPCRTTDADQCASCREIAESRSMDVLEIDAASHTQVDNIREVVIASIGIAPARDRFKIFIIDEVHMLSGHSFNALLKTIEEPPPRVVFVMATTESHKIPATILSRSQQFEFRTIAAPRIFDRLRLIADAEKIEVADDALREIARAGEGSMRDAQSAFDQVISFSTGPIAVADVETALGIAGAEMRRRVVSAVSEQKPSEVLAVVEDLVMRGHDLRNFCRDLLAHVRDMLVVKVAGEMAEAGEAERKELAREAQDFSESDLVRFFHSLTETEKAVRESAHPRYQLEIGLVKLIEMRRLTPLSQILERLNSLEESLRSGKGVASGSGPAPPAATPVPNTSGGSSSSNAPARRTGGSSSSTGESASSGTTGEQTGAMLHNSQASTDALDDVAVSHPSDAETPPFEPPPTRARVEPSIPHATVEHSSPRSSIPTLPSKAAPTTRASAPSTPSPDMTTMPARAASAPPMPQQSAPLKLVPPSPAAVSARRDPATLEWGAPPGSVDPHAPPSFFDEPHAEALGGEQSGVATSSAGSAAFSLGKSGAAGVSPAFAASSVVTDAAVEGLKQMLDKRRKPLLVSALEGARRVSMDGEELYIEYAPEGKHLRDALAKPDNARLLREACREIKGRDVGLRIVVKEAGEDGDTPLSQRDEEHLEQQRLRELAEQHPLVQQVLKTFRAEIIDVRRVEPQAE